MAKKLDLMEEKRKEELVTEVLEDFRRRQQERKNFESQWRLNMNYVLGNQYCSINSNNEVENYDKRYFWQEREVYNHLASIVEIRLSKLNGVRPRMSVLPSSADIKDISASKMSKAVLDSLQHKVNLSEKLSEGASWSEICGTCFYKVTWDSNAGKVVTMDPYLMKEGDVDISVIPPFEIFPFNSAIADMECNPSIIHARAYPVETIKDLYGVEVVGETLDVYSLTSTNTISGFGYTQNITSCGSEAKENHALVIEKYILPTVEYPNGRLIIIAKDRLVYDGELPYVNGVDGARTYPFIRQTSVNIAGCFWGISVIERAIPVQRAYNALKNRKLEYLNRLSMGVMMVEDGSVDVDDLEDEGLSPGKVLVYRQGANPPSMMSANRLPIDFASEENRLLNEFSIISGISDLMRQSEAVYANLSGTALQLLIEQDTSRLSCSIDSIKFAVVAIAKQSLRLYKQFAVVPRLARIMGEKNSTEVFYFTNSDLGGDDIICDSESELATSKANQRSLVFELLNSGLLQDENGQISNEVRLKVLEMLGVGIYDSKQDLSQMHIKSAQKENLHFSQKDFSDEVQSYDEHELHIKEHIAFLLSSDADEINKDKALKQKVLDHINMHKSCIKLMQGE